MGPGKRRGHKRTVRSVAPDRGPLTRQQSTRKITTHTPGFHHRCKYRSHADTEKFPEGRFLPLTGPARPADAVDGRVPSRLAAPRFSNDRQHHDLPHSRAFLEPDTHSLPSADNRSSVSTLVHRLTTDCNLTPLERLHDSIRLHRKLFL